MAEVVQHTMPVSRTTVETDNKVVTKSFSVGKPKAYSSTEAVYVDGTLFKAGEVFVTGMPEGSTWDLADPKERAAADAGKQIKDDVNLDAMDVPALQAHAASLRINVGAAKSKPDLITVIKAANVPAL